MNKIVKNILGKGQKILKQQATDLFEQGANNIKSAANEQLSNIINNSVQKISNKANNLINTSPTEEDDYKLTGDDTDEYSIEKYEDGDKFEENLRGDLKGVISSLAAANPEEAATAVNNMLAMAAEVTKFTEAQKTKRKEIEAKRDIIVKKIESQKEIILVYLEKSFDERRDNFTKLFTVVDSAIANNNMQQLALGLDSINKLASSSPFKALASLESTKLALEDKNQEWDF
jgi:hypothetical protein